jgi:hypothetical protein
MKKKYQIILIGFCFASFINVAASNKAQAGSLGLVKVNQTAARGLCLPDRHESVSSVLRKNEISLFTGDNQKPSARNKTGVSNRRSLSNSDDRAEGVANVIHAVDHMGDGKFKAHEGVRFVFGNRGKSSANSRRTLYDIQLNPGNQNITGVGTSRNGGTHNRALIAHELGHYVGRVLYNKYFSAVRSRCRLTRYAGKNRNEEFAEVFAAYITNPALFSGKGRHCKSAFKFFADEFNEKNINMSCDSRLKSLETKTVVTAVETSLIPVPRPRPDMSVAVQPIDYSLSTGYIESGFVLPNLDDLPIPSMRPLTDQNNQSMALKYPENLEDHDERSSYIESYYTYAFEDSPLFEYDEEEEDEHYPELMGP